MDRQPRPFVGPRGGSSEWQLRSSPSPNQRNKSIQSARAARTLIRLDLHDAADSQPPPPLPPFRVVHGRLRRSRLLAVSGEEASDAAEAEDCASLRPDAMTVFALIIINKAGGLVYNKTFHDGGLNKISTNDYLVLAGTFHGVHAITARLNPVKATPPSNPHSAPNLHNRPESSSGLEVLETENFRMQCFNTLTGTKFLLFTDTTQVNVDLTLRRIYDLYADYVMKNPFYSLEMPIRCDIFDRKLLSYIREINNR
ncbi:hypothetical protein XA68_18316 [Ophiocordyceps unilateralis]|uniref:Trafficking protein particle complex subunit n=1 Tax=Ophiocordyceps unilateralis TaxID=268505 RepID=A0A2A9PHT3_OPHUN|nr:hypothetical protein XA68_18316 [Ophiocordyceps unilateralis]